MRLERVAELAVEGDDVQPAAGQTKLHDPRRGGVDEPAAAAAIRAEKPVRPAGRGR